MARTQPLTRPLPPAPPAPSLLSFVLWYVTPAVPAVSDYLGTPAMIACLFGATLAVTAALQAGMVSRRE